MTAQSSPTDPHAERLPLSAVELRRPHRRAADKLLVARLRAAGATSLTSAV